MFYVYMITNKRNGTLYVGHTDNIRKRMGQHKQKLIEGFSKTYGLDRLVWYEIHETRHDAFTRERRIKEWNRAWKIKRIEAMNPDWRDLITNAPF